MNTASIPLFDLGIVRGYGIFDYLRTYNKVPFHLHEHISRFIASAKSIGLFVPKTISELKSIVMDMIDKVEADELSIKLILTGGISEDQLTFKNAPTLAIAVYPFSALVTQEEYSRGFSLKTTTYQRILPESKTLVYLPALLALQEAKKLGFDDAIYLNGSNHLLESTTSNFFAFKAGKLYTPNKEVLHGITRKIIITIAKQHFQVYEQPISYAELKYIDEIFLSSSNKEIVPVIQIDSQKISTKPGKNTQFLIKKFTEYTKSYSESFILNKLKNIKKNNYIEETFLNGHSI